MFPHFLSHETRRQKTSSSDCFSAPFAFRLCEAKKEKRAYISINNHAPSVFA